MLLPVHPEPRPGERVPSTPSNDPGCQLHQRETEGGGRCLPDRGSRSWEGLSFLGRAPAPTPPPAPGAGLKPTGLYPPPLGWEGPGTVAFSGFLIWKTRAAPHCHGEGAGAGTLGIMHELCSGPPCLPSLSLCPQAWHQHPLLCTWKVLRPQSAPGHRQPQLRRHFLQEGLPEHLLSLSSRTVTVCLLN